MRDISGRIRKRRKDQLEALVRSYEKALEKAKDDTTKNNLNELLKKARNEINKLK